MTLVKVNKRGKTCVVDLDGRLRAILKFPSTAILMEFVNEIQAAEKSNN